VLLHYYSRLSITAYAADYFTALRALREAGITATQGKRTIALFLGSNIGNFDRDESLAFHGEIRRMLRVEDGLLVGADLKKPVELLTRAYDDPLGVTSAFDRNLLVRINRELDGDFDVGQFEHRASYNGQLGRIESHLVSRRPQTVRIKAIGLTVNFDLGESIHTENSYKFDLDQLSELGRRAGFVLKRTWFDSAGQFSFNLLAATEYGGS
jgi:uncharacterized SAM-dependent methyltransferase